MTEKELVFDEQNSWIARLMGKGSDSPPRKVQASSKQRHQLSLNEMNRGTASLVYFTLLIAAVLLLAGCSSEPDPATATPSTTVETEATSSAEEAVSFTESEESDTQIVVTPTLAPTPTPGPVDNLVAELVEDTIIADFSFLGLTSENWINLAISLLIILLGYVVAGWLIGVGLRRLVRRSGIEIADVFLNLDPVSDPERLVRKYYQPGDGI